MAAHARKSSRFLQADAPELTPDAARYWPSVTLPTSDQERVDDLSAKARFLLQTKANLNPSVNVELTRTVWERAKACCEYCCRPQAAFPLRFRIDHIQASHQEGETVAEHLTLACPYCNRRKGLNAAGFDPASGKLVGLFHPDFRRLADGLVVKTSH